MKLKYLKFNNFFSHSDSEINFDNVEAISLIVGSIAGSERKSNGAGKSTIIEAILYALYERTRISESQNGTLDDMVRWNSSGAMQVELQFEIDSLYRIMRSRDIVKKKSIVTFEVFDGTKWKSKTGAKKKATNQEILDTIGIDYDTFNASICFQQKEVDNFISATEQQRKSIIKNILQLDIYDKYRIEAKAIADGYSAQLQVLEQALNTAQVNILDIESKKQSLSDLENRVRIYEIEKSALDAQLEKLRKQQVALNGQVEKRANCINLIKEKQGVVDRLAQNTKLANLKYVEYQKLHAAKATELLDLRTQLDQIKDKFIVEKADIMKDGKRADVNLKAAEKQFEQTSEDYHKLCGEVESLKRDISNIQSLHSARCPTCYNHITEETKGSSLKFLEAHLDLLTQRALGLKESYEEARRLVTLYRKQLDEVKERLQEYSRWIKEKLHLQDSTRRLEESIAEATMIMQDQLATLQENESLSIQYKSEIEKSASELFSINIDQERFDSLNKQITEKHSKLMEANALLLETQIRRGRLQVELTQAQDALEKTKRLRAEREMVIQEKFYYDGLAKYFGKEIPSYIIENTCQELSEEANKVLKNISNDSIEFVTQRQNKDGTQREVFEVEVHRPGVEKPILMDNLSNGQKFRMVFAIRIALSRLLVRRRNSTTMDFLFYDECFSSLDEEGIDDVIDVFKYLKNEFAHQLIITHRADLKDRFGKNVIVVQQDAEGVSKVAI